MKVETILMKSIEQSLAHLNIANGRIMEGGDAVSAQDEGSNLWPRV